ncbi:retrotransposon gag domain, retroviral aspartyl protease [Tanacetum coccineum]
MVQTRNSDNNNPPDPISTQLAAIAAKLEAIETMKEDIAALKEGDRSRSKGSKNFDGESSWRGRQSYRPYNKIDFPNFSGGDPRGWLLKAKKLQEFAKRSSRVSNWPDHCLLGVFLNGLKDELKSDVRIHKPRTVYSAMSLALEFESKLTNHQPGKNASCTPILKPSESDSKPTNFTPTQTSQPKYTFGTFEAEKQNRFLKGEGFRCGDKYEPGHLCKTGTLKVLEADEDVEEPLTTDLADLESDREETAKISLHAILGKPHPTTMKVHGMLHSTEVLILIDGGSTHNFISDVLVNELKLATQPLAPFGVQIGNGDCNSIGQNLQKSSVRINDLKYSLKISSFSLEVLICFGLFSMVSTLKFSSSQMERIVHDFFNRREAI